MTVCVIDGGGDEFGHLRHVSNVSKKSMFLTRKYDHVQMSQLDDWKIKSFILGLKSGLS